MLIPQLAFSFIMVQMLPRHKEAHIHAYVWWPLYSIQDYAIELFCYWKCRSYQTCGDIRADVQRSCGVEVDHASQFLRAKIHQEVFFSEKYTRVKTRNSYTVIYSQGGVEKYGIVQYFLSLSDQAVAVIQPLTVSTSPTCYPSQLSILHSRIKPVVMAGYSRA